MAKVRCLATTYMPSGKSGPGKPKFTRYEDWHEEGDDVYAVPGNRLQEFLDTGNFERVKDELPAYQPGLEGEEEGLVK